MKPDAVDKSLRAMLEPDEEVVSIVHRHFIGIAGLFVGVLAGIAVIIIFFVLVTPDLINDLSLQSNRAILAGIILVATVLLIFLFVSVHVYRQNRLMITNKNLVQISQKSLFIRKISRLSIATVEDVSADQRGLLATIFNYGTLHVQTAGKTENFEFKTCPDPNRYSDEIIKAREAYAEALKELK